MARRIVYQLVAPMEKTLGTSEIERRRDYLQRHAAAGIEIKDIILALDGKPIENARQFGVNIYQKADQVVLERVAPDAVQPELVL